MLRAAHGMHFSLTRDQVKRNPFVDATAAEIFQRKNQEKKNEEDSLINPVVQQRSASFWQGRRTCNAVLCKAVTSFTGTNGAEMEPRGLARAIKDLQLIIPSCTDLPLWSQCVPERDAYCHPFLSAAQRSTCDCRGPAHTTPCVQSKCVYCVCSRRPCFSRQH